MIGLGMNAHGLGDHERAAAAYTEGAELARAGGYTWFLAIATQQPGRSRPGAGRLRAGRGLASRKASNSSASSATSERSRRASSVSASSRLARAGATRPRRFCVKVSSTPRRWSTKKSRSGALEELAALAVSGGEAERAATLLGAIETLREETGHAGHARRTALAEEQTRSALASELGEEQLRRRPPDRPRDDVRADNGVRAPELETQQHPARALGRSVTFAPRLSVDRAGNAPAVTRKACVSGV